MKRQRPSILTPLAKDGSRLEWSEVIAIGLCTGLIYEIEDGYAASYRPEIEFSQHLIRFATALENAVRTKCKVEPQNTPELLTPNAQAHPKNCRSEAKAGFSGAAPCWAEDGGK